MKNEIISQHKLLKDTSKRAKIKRIIIVWAIFLALFLITRIPEVQKVIFEYVGKSKADFITNGLIIVFIPMIIGTITFYREKQNFDRICIYKKGIYFIDSKNNTQDYVDFDNLELSYGNMQQSFYIKSASKNIKEKEYAWCDFDYPDVLRNNLERYGKIN